MGKRKGHIKIFFYAPPEFREQLRMERKSRGKSFGVLIQEAFASRVRLVRR